MRTLTDLTTPASAASDTADTTRHAPAAKGFSGSAARHESAVKHVTGRAAYIDDLALPADALHLAVGLSPVASGRITGLDLSA
ncbi:hypothetical protein R0K18_23365, partial [Pantoea sp. SIMBA_133]